MKKFILAFCLFSFTFLYADALWQAPGAEHLPGSQTYPYPISAARWVWFQAPEVKADARAYYRYTVTLDEPVTDAWAFVLMDDKGTMLVNGKAPRYQYLPQSSSFQLKIPRYELKPLLKPGKNLLTFEIYNKVNTGGLFLRGEITLASGKKIKLLSDKNIKAADKAADNWRSADFDDSKWGNAMEFGDVLTSPWNTASNIIGFGLSDDEKKIYQDSFKQAVKIPETIAKEPLPQVKIDYSRLVPALRVNGKLLPPVLHKPGDPFAPERADIILKFAHTGIKWLELGVLDYDIIRENGFDFSLIDSQIRRALTLAPETYLGICIRFSQRNYLWMKNNPDELIKYPTGEADQNNDTLRRRAPSMASEKYRKEMTRIINAFFDFAKKQPWYPRLISCRVANGCYLEWHYYGMRRDMPDVSMPMTLKFREFLTRRYKSDSALQKAWQDPQATLANAKVPGTVERINKGNFLRNPSDGKDRQTMDYYECMQHVLADTLLHCADTAKKAAPHLLTGAYYGYILQMNFPSEGQTILLDKVLSSPCIDFLSAPICYDDSRSPSSDGLKRSIASIFARHKKLHISEQDTRTHITYPKVYTPAHSAELFARDTLSAFLDGCGTQFLSIHNPGGRHWMNSPEILSSIHAQLKMWEKLSALPAEKRHAADIAVVFNTPEMYLHGFPTVEKQKIPIQLMTTEPFHALNRSGYIYDIFDLKGFLASKNSYKAVVMLNSFTISPEDQAALKAKLHAPGVTAIWHYAPGLVTADNWSAANAADLTGIKFRLISGGKLSIQGVKIKHQISVSHRLAVDDPAATEKLPYSDAPGEIGMAKKTLPSGAVAIFSGAPITDPALWHKLFRSSGIKQLAAPGQVMLGFGKRMLIPVHKKTVVKFTLPEKSRSVTELISGNSLPAGMKSLDLRSNGPAVYLIEW